MEALPRRAYKGIRAYKSIQEHTIEEACRGSLVEEGILYKGQSRGSALRFGVRVRVRARHTLQELSWGVGSGYCCHAGYCCRAGYRYRTWWGFRLRRVWDHLAELQGTATGLDRINDRH